MERRKMKKKGFTLVELLVVIAIIAMLLAILMPALGKVRQLAQRIMCSTNLSGLGKAMLTYSNDDKYESFPIGGASSAMWHRGNGTVAAKRTGELTYDWRIPTFSDTSSGNKYTTISSCLYLLVRIADTTPDQFICPGSDNKKFELNNYKLHDSYKQASFSEVWDFGNATDEVTAGTMGKGHNTYSYQLPLALQANQAVYPISTTSNPARPVMADRNPYLTDGANQFLYTWDATKKVIYQESIIKGNNTYHQKEGQNVLYADNHAKFEKQANVGIQQDNIYTVWGATSVIDTEEDRRQCGVQSNLTGRASTTASNETSVGSLIATGTNTYRPQHEDDSYLVSDIDKYAQ